MEWVIGGGLLWYCIVCLLESREERRRAAEAPRLPEPEEPADLELYR